MRKLTVICSLAAVSAVLPAQCPGTTTFSTLFAGTTYLGSPDPMVGANMLFDLTLVRNITICELDVNLLDDGAQTPNQVGATTQLLFWTTPGTYVGNHTNQALWTQVGTGTLTVAAQNQPSRVVFNPPVFITAGTYGIALQHMPSTTGPSPGPIHPLYTNPAARPGTSLTYSDPDLTLTAGAGQAVAFVGGLASPRVINTNIRYTPDPNSAGFTMYGQGCYSPNELTLTPDARPVLGTNINLVTSNIPTAVTPAGFLFVSLGQITPGIELTALGMMGCFQHITPGFTNFYLVMNSTESFPLTIPNNMGLIGLLVYAQSATLSAGVNTAGVLSSNGVELRIGT